MLNRLIFGDIIATCQHANLPGSPRGQTARQALESSMHMRLPHFSAHILECSEGKFNHKQKRINGALAFLVLVMDSFLCVCAICVEIAYPYISSCRKKPRGGFCSQLTWPTKPSVWCGFFSDFLSEVDGSPKTQDLESGNKNFHSSLDLITSLLDY